MAHLIDKSALVAEKERMQDAYIAKLESRGMGHEEAVMASISYINGINDVINSLEVKEVDLDDAKKEELAQKYIEYTFKRQNIYPDSREGQLIYYAYMHGMNQCLTQLKAQKGEKV